LKRPSDPFAINIFQLPGGNEGKAVAEGEGGVREGRGNRMEVATWGQDKIGREEQKAWG